MNTFLKGFFLVIGIGIVGIGIIIFSFIQDTRSDPDEEAKVKEQAQQYLDQTFNYETEIFDTLYDNMGNFNFEYAAKVESKKDHIQFLVYLNNESNEMEDSYISEKWTKELETIIQPPLERKLGKLDASQFLVFYDHSVGSTFNIDPNKPSSYKDSLASPAIKISLDRKPEAGDEKLFNELVSIIKKESQLKHASITLNYIDKKGVILDEKEWIHTF
ncbi:hypothetical protein [Peribacillus asahii]|uniref:hypothetical protein n=1 Tax=Peribacillus asahii TaxID=228899 RepID=UPI0020794C52|nr:hypothetical protein [Peribacillus asahii]USK60565.1 hypothetical protein LIT37_04330 [Peribacillus asahii]